VFTGAVDSLFCVFIFFSFLHFRNFLSLFLFAVTESQLAKVVNYFKGFQYCFFQNFNIPKVAEHLQIRTHLVLFWFISKILTIFLLLFNLNTVPEESGVCESMLKSDVFEV